MKKIFAIMISLSLLAALSLAQAKDERLAKIEQELKGDVPRLLCLNENFATAGQPADAAFAKLASHGFKSVLNLRTDAEGVDLAHEREMIEKAGLRYINIPVGRSPFKEDQVKEFIATVKDKTNQPMLIHCASANRVGAFWMVYLVLDQGLAEDKALEEATRIGLTSAELKKAAQDYIAAHKQVAK
ncbi:MAG TPA: protein tyrosine phosphatase family protein [Blastocatellia bacterium]